jgi:hypothetical protein
MPSCVLEFCLPSTLHQVDQMSCAEQIILCASLQGYTYILEVLWCIFAFSDARCCLLYYVLQIGMLEDVRVRTLQGVARAQAVYKGYKVRLEFKKTRKTIIFLQCSECSLAFRLILAMSAQSLVTKFSGWD